MNNYFWYIENRGTNKNINMRLGISAQINDKNYHPYLMFSLTITNAMNCDAYSIPSFPNINNL